MKILQRFMPAIFIPGYSRDDFRTDLISGLTVALVLIPQSLAYAQLVGLPAYFGLYAAFLPPIVAALFSSSRQLATGPVAMVALMAATALAPLASAGSEGFIAYVIILTLMVGLVQLILGILRLGIIINFLSHPVINGFTIGAAVIIATSQLDTLLGVTVEKATYHYETIWRIIMAAFENLHLMTLMMAALAFVIMLTIKRINPRLPYILTAVIITTVLSWAINFEKKRIVTIDDLQSTELVQKLDDYDLVLGMADSKSMERLAVDRKIDSLKSAAGDNEITVMKLQARSNLIDKELENLRAKEADCRKDIRHLTFLPHLYGTGQVFYTQATNPQYPGKWRLKIGYEKPNRDSLTVYGGGAVIGDIPAGLPSFRIPKISWSVIWTLLPAAMVISLLGFVEAVSIAKAMASRGGYRLDANKELIGQGLANTIGSLTSSFPVAGSFARSALNFQTGAVSGLSNAISGLVAAIVLVFFTPLLYYVPETVLAAIIIVAASSLINLKGFVHTWKARRFDGVVGVITFVSTMAFAPRLDKGLIIGIVLSGLAYLYRTMKPKIALLARHEDGSYRNRERFHLRQCPYIAVVRYQGSLYFANVDYLEAEVMKIVDSMPELKHVHFVGNGINEIDASGEEILELLFERLRKMGLRVTISGLNDSVLEAIERTGFYDKIGEENMFRNLDRALEATWYESHLGGDEKNCPLKSAPYIKPLPTTRNIPHDDPRYE